MAGPHCQRLLCVLPPASGEQQSVLPGGPTGLVWHRAPRTNKFPTSRRAGPSHPLRHPYPTPAPPHFHLPVVPAGHEQFGNLGAGGLGGEGSSHRHRPCLLPHQHVSRADSRATGSGHHHGAAPAGWPSRVMKKSPRNPIGLDMACQQIAIREATSGLRALYQQPVRGGGAAAGAGGRGREPATGLAAYRVQRPGRWARWRAPLLIVLRRLGV